MRAALRQDAVLTARRLEDGEVLAEQPGRLDRELLEFAGERDRIPIAPQQLAHRRTRRDLGQLVVLFGRQHDKRSCTRNSLDDGGSVDDRDGAGVAVHPQPLSGLDGLGAERRAGHGGQPVLAAHDRGVAHDPAHVGHGRRDLAEHRCPARRGQRRSSLTPLSPQSTALSDGGRTGKRGSVLRFFSSLVAYLTTLAST